MVRITTLQMSLVMMTQNTRAKVRQSSRNRPKKRQLSQRVLIVVRMHLRVGATQRQKVRSVVIRPFWQPSSQSILQMLLLRGDSPY